MYIHNRIALSYRDWNVLIDDMFKAVGEERPTNLAALTKKIEEISKKIARASKPKGDTASEFANWNDYISQIAKTTSKRINEIFLFQDKLDLEIIDRLSKAETEILNWNLTYLDKVVIGNEDLHFTSHGISMIYIYLQDAAREFKEIYKEHEKEYHRQHRSITKGRKSS